MTTLEGVMEEARKKVEGPADRFVERLAERIGAQTGVKAVFGEPLQRGDLTVIPVARIRWGVGGGAGDAGDASAPGDSGERVVPRGSGSGGGGGAIADPIGYLEVGPNGAAFRPIIPPYPSPWFLLAAGITAALVIRALARLIRG